jgi:hypothetical protein
MSDTVYVIKVTLGGGDFYVSAGISYDTGRTLATTDYEPLLAVATRWQHQDDARRQCDLMRGFLGPDTWARIRPRVVRVRSVKKSGG